MPYREPFGLARRKEVVVASVSGQSEQTSELGEQPQGLTAVHVMWERFLELERTWQGRLANQAQVIENLSADNRRLRGVVGAAQDVVEDLKVLTVAAGLTEREHGNYAKIHAHLSAALATLEG